MLIKILLGGLFKKLDLTEFETEKSDCRFGTFRLVGDWVISSKFETITIKEHLLRYCRKYLLSFLKIFGKLWNIMGKARQRHLFCVSHTVGQWTIIVYIWTPYLTQNNNLYLDICCILKSRNIFELNVLPIALFGYYILIHSVIFIIPIIQSW